MIIDCHTHLAFPLAETEATRHTEVCAKVDTALVLSGRCEDAKKAQKQLSDYVGRNGKMIGFAAINPVEDKIGMRSMTALKETGIKGAVLYCCEDQLHPTHSRAMRFYCAAEELGMPVFFHNTAPFERNSILDYAQPFLLDEVARQFPSLRIIIGRMGLPFIDQTLCMLVKHENVFADLSIRPPRIWEVYNIVVRASEAGVMDKLLFGSGYPENDPGQCIETLLGFNRLLADTKLPTVPREQLRSIIERDTLGILGLTR
ncbi:MAG: amidohydrolase family protein [Sedimentisphaerales bacterium]|nr:amidohydrolase family protein [Sedimentisphaerales bacterium]